MNLFTKRFGLVLAGVIGVGAVASLAIGASLALFSSTATTQNNQISTGTLVLTSTGSPVTESLYTGSLEPGPYSTWQTNHSNSYSTYTLNYTGSVNAFVGLDFSITSTAPSACTDLSTLNGGEPYSGTVTIVNHTPTTAGQVEVSAPTGSAVTGTSSCTDVGSLPIFVAGGAGIGLYVHESNTDYSNDWLTASQLESAATCTAASSVITCSANVPNLEIPYAAISPSTTLPNSGMVEQNDMWPGLTSSEATAHSQTLTLGVNLPLSAGNQFQGGSATISLSGHAVQYDNNNTVPNNGSPGYVSTDPACAANTNFGTQGDTTCPISWS